MKDNKIVSLSVSIDVGVLDGALGADAASNSAHIIPFAALPNRNLAIIPNKEVIIAVAVKVCEPDLAARLSNAWRNLAYRLPLIETLIEPSASPAFRIDRDQVITAVSCQVGQAKAGALGAGDTKILPHANASIISNSEEIGQAVAIHICEPYSIASDARYAGCNSTKVFPVAPTLFDGIAKGLDCTAVVDNQIVYRSVSFGSNLPILLLAVLAVVVSVARPFNSTTTIDNDIVGITVTINVFEMDLIPRFEASCPLGIERLELLSIVNVLPDLGRTTFVQGNEVSLSVVIDISKTDHVAFDGLPIWIDISNTSPIIRLTAIDPGPNGTIVVGDDIVSDAITIQVGQNDLVAATILDRSADGAN
ncbi:hypothetical protein HG531_013589 [Fusarium graminearum]|nr:hypothetical protein HG531_013589 [Fusarium graminearum]